jgi:hypothetical protein
MSLLDTLMHPIAVQASGAIDQHEVRASRYGAYNVFKKQTESNSAILDSEVRAAIKNSNGRTIEIPVLDADNITLGTTRTCTIGDEHSTSGIVTLTFVPVTFAFSMFPASYGNNRVKYAQDWANKMNQRILKVNAHLDTLCLNTLESKKNVVWGSGVTNIYPAVGNALQVKKSQQDQFYNTMSALMESMDYYGEYDVIANTLHRPLVSKLINQGAANAENKQFQFGPFGYNYTNRLTNAAGVESTAFVLPQGSVAIENRNDRDSIAGHSIGTHQEWSEVEIPGLGRWGALYLESCADASAIVAGAADLTATKREAYRFSTDFVIATSYNSDPATRTNPIIKAQLSVNESIQV